MNKTTYLLGAGASLPYLPIGSELANQIARSTHLIRQGIEQEQAIPGMPYPEALRPFPRGPIAKHMLSAFEDVGEKGENSGSIDNYARNLTTRLTMTPNRDAVSKELARIKNVLCCYFLFRQRGLRGSTRHNDFLSKLHVPPSIDNPSLIPTNCSILSWNYDAFVEMAYYDICHDKSRSVDDVLNGSSVVKLNGIAGALEQVSESPTDTRYLGKLVGQDLSVMEIVDLYDQLDRGQVSAKIDFAWEMTPTDLRKKTAVAANSSNLVIIGYSFPDFNTDVDRALFRQLGENLRKVYYQIPEQDMIPCKTRMMRRMTDKQRQREEQFIQHVADEDKFLRA